MHLAKNKKVEARNLLNSGKMNILILLGSSTVFTRFATAGETELKPCYCVYPLIAVNSRCFMRMTRNLVLCNRSGLQNSMNLLRLGSLNWVKTIKQLEFSPAVTIPRRALVWGHGANRNIGSLLLNQRVLIADVNVFPPNWGIRIPKIYKSFHNFLN